MKSRSMSNEMVKENFLFSRLTLNNTEKAINIAEKSYLMENSVNNILNSVLNYMDSSGKDNHYKDPKLNLKKMTKVYKRKEKLVVNNSKRIASQGNKQEMMNEINKSKNNSKSINFTKKITLLEKTFSNIINSDETFMNSKEFLSAQAKKIMTKKNEEDKRKERVLKRIGFVGDGFVESLMMNTDKNFNVQKFLDINMYQILKGKKKEPHELKLYGPSEPVHRLAHIKEMNNGQNDELFNDFSINEEIDYINQRCQFSQSILKDLHPHKADKKTYIQSLQLDLPLIEDQKLFDDLTGVKKKNKSKKKPNKSYNGQILSGSLTTKKTKNSDKLSFNNIYSKNLFYSDGNKLKSYFTEGMKTRYNQSPIKSHDSTKFSLAKNLKFEFDKVKNLSKDKNRENKYKKESKDKKSNILNN
jgi:hypothetical protein